VVQFENLKSCGCLSAQAQWVMAQRKSKLNKNQSAAAIVGQNTSDDAPATFNGKNPAAVMLADLGELKGGKRGRKACHPPDGKL
jgi:hypothetical protein